EEQVEEEPIEEIKEEKPEEPKVTEEKLEIPNKPESQNKVEVQNKSEVPSSKESNKQSKLLPQTGGAAVESTSILAGMFALILGAIMFRRQKN
ncbi:LPXTG cell wall anchor domain-containing protein, partial [Bacillus tropicus]|uniref:LPXTG cell wall anchor domain-containing protein n=1 Tax=Bacillus tropicus TaxID=2026188 RepID=UPI002E1FDB4C|nr:LPXTG cell wall anchor domain-containing protein [Bacillus tropicus]